MCRIRGYDNVRVTFASRIGRRILATTILASGMAFLDSTVVNVALPRIEEDLGGGFATIQWVLSAYLLTLGSLVLVGGALGDSLCSGSWRSAVRSVQARRR